MAVNRYSYFAPFCEAAGLPRPTDEYRFHPTRKWRFDFAWLFQLVALEVDGGTFQRKGGVLGGHSRGSGQRNDREKRNAAIVLGWRVLVVAPEELMRPQTIVLIQGAMEWQAVPRRC